MKNPHQVVENCPTHTHTHTHTQIHSYTDREALSLEFGLKSHKWEREVRINWGLRWKKQPHKDRETAFPFHHGRQRKRRERNDDKDLTVSQSVSLTVCQSRRTLNSIWGQANDQRERGRGRRREDVRALSSTFANDNQKKTNAKKNPSFSNHHQNIFLTFGNKRERGRGEKRVAGSWKRPLFQLSIRVIILFYFVTRINHSIV